ncbi:MAG: DUF364 domain-containing protein [Dehalococcoidales bacterium]|nr:DUF364 domain-containing protein [Dehalococcoidales bacterium]
MKILDDLISVLNTEVELKDIRQGFFHTAVLTDRCGLAATLPKDVIKQDNPWVEEPGFLLNKSVSEVVKMAYSERLLEASIGMAAINSLLEIDENRCEDLNAGDLIAEKGQGKRITIVGHFPFIPKLREVASILWVIEKNPEEGDASESETGNCIPRSDVVGITGTAFTNHTIESLLKMCRPGAYVVILGDTAPLSPLLFDYGISAISGTKVVDPALTLRCISQGANYRQIKGVRKLTMVR